MPSTQRAPKKEETELRLEQKQPQIPKHGAGYKHSQARAHGCSGAVSQKRQQHDCNLLEQAIVVKDTVKSSVPVCNKSMWYSAAELPA